MSWLAVARKHRRERQNAKAFEPYYNGTQGTAFKLPANAVLFVRATAATASRTPALTVGADVISVPELVANEVHECVWAERGVEVKAETGFTLLIDLGLGRYMQVGAIA